MTDVTTAWLIGSVRDLQQQGFTIDASLVSIAAGSWYLYHPTAGLSLIGAVAAQMAAAGVVAPAAVILKNRKIKISSSGTFSITWPADGVLRDLLGFTGDLAGQSTYTATNISPLLWSPAGTESPLLAPLGVVGHEQHQAYHSASPFDGTRSVVAHGSRTRNKFTWKKVATSRVQTASAAGGELVVFWDEVLSQGSLFYLWRNIVEDTASATAVTWTSSLGPYVSTDDDWDFIRSSGFEWTDRWNSVELSVEKHPEYS